MCNVVLVVAVWCCWLLCVVVRCRLSLFVAGCLIVFVVVWCGLVLFGVV